MVYAIDFDGTLCENAWPEIGEPKQSIIDYCKDLHIHGHKLILWTCRERELLMQAVAWCAEHGLWFDAINSNLPERMKEWGTDPRKIGADFYLDDRSLFLEGVNT